MKPFLFFLFLVLSPLIPVFGQSSLLESVKKNPGGSIEICNKFKELNSKGISANSDKAIKYVAKKNKLSPVDAEIYSIYVIALYCSEII